MSRGFVVVGVDVPGTSGDAVRWAAEAAALHAVPLKLVHAVDEVTGLPGGEVAAEDDATREVLRENTASGSVLAEAEELVREQHPDLQIQSLEVVGDAVQVMLEQQENSLLVVGTGHRNSLSELILGSTSLAVAMHAVSPVVVVPPGSEDQAESHGVVAVAVDGSADSAVAAHIACREAKVRGARVLAINTWGLEVVDGFVVTESDADQFAAIQDRQTALVERTLASARRDYPDVQVDIQVIHGQVAKSLIEQSESADLMVLGSRGRGGFAGKLLGSVSQKVLRGSRCAVVIAKAPTR